MKKIVHANSYRPRLQLNCIYNIVNCYDIMKKRENKSKREITRDNVRKYKSKRSFTKKFVHDIIIIIPILICS